MIVKNPAYSDKYLLENTSKLINTFGVDTIYETGTCVGGSTMILGNMFPNITIYTYETNKVTYDLACKNCKTNTKIILRNISSVDGLNKDVIPEKNNVLFFLDAHWGSYWPLKDELLAIKNKNIKPVIIIHDFFVPGNNGKPKFRFDSYKGQALNFNYIKKALDEIYKTDYDYHYADKVELNSGVIYIYRKSK